MVIDLHSFKDDTKSFSISANLEGQELTILDHSLDPALEKINGRPEIEVTIKIKDIELQKLVLNLLKEKFNSDSALSEMENWLKKQKIDYSKNTY